MLLHIVNYKQRIINLLTQNKFIYINFQNNYMQALAINEKKYIKKQWMEHVIFTYTTEN